MEKMPISNSRSASLFSMDGIPHFFEALPLALSDGATPRNMSIIGLAVAMGMGLSAAPQSLYLFPDWVTTIFGKAPVVVASMIAISLNQILPKRHGNPTT